MNSNTHLRLARIAINLDRLDHTLRVPAAEYVPAIADAFGVIDQLKKDVSALQETLVDRSKKKPTENLPENVRKVNDEYR